MIDFKIKECVGECPKCGFEDLDYKANIIHNGDLHYPFTCSNCGLEGTERHEVVYMHTTYYK